MTRHKNDSLNYMINDITLPTTGDFCCLLIVFTNSLDPDQDGKNVLIWIQTV